MDAVTRLDRWLEHNGWAGYDPYDLLGTPFFLYCQRLGSDAPLPARGLRRGALVLENRFPRFLRRVLRVQKQVNAKGMGLLAKAYLNLFTSLGQERFKSRACEILNWLVEHPAEGYKGTSWGYPFDWQSRVFIPRGTTFGGRDERCRRRLLACL